jgi:hypothetical protein
MDRPSREAYGGPFTGRMTTGQPDRIVSSVPEVRRTPLNFQKVQNPPMNFNLVLRLLSFIYSDLFVLYIYDLDPELFCSFML